MFFGDYSNATDEKLAELAGNNDQRAFSEILERYRPLIMSKVIRHVPAGMESDDLMQECALALLDAVMCYSDEKGAALKTFAGVCIDNRIKSVLRQSLSEKNRLMYECVDLTDEVRSDDLSANPETMLLLREDVDEQTRFLEKNLSGREYGVFVRFMSGMSYEEISSEMKISEKAVDNALSRARKKLRRTQKT